MMPFRTLRPGTTGKRVLALAAVAVLAACGKQQATSQAPHLPPAQHAPTRIDVVRIELGTAAKPDGTIEHPTALFRPHDPVFAAVHTERAAQKVKLQLHWVYAIDDLIRKDTKVISPSGDAVTMFTIRDDGGWPMGTYHVEAWVDDQKVALATFSVQP